MHNVWHFEGGALEPLVHRHEVIAVAYNGSGTLLATATHHGTVHVWNQQCNEIRSLTNGIILALFYSFMR